jgi:rhamnosyltransferase subunit B
MMQPKRILFATLGSLGDLYPYLAVASEMQRRGHQATILTSSQHRSRIEQSGVRFQQAAPDLDFIDKTFQELAMREATGGRYMLRDVILPQIRVSYENLLDAASHADLLVTQMLAYAGPLVAEKTGIPWVSTVLAPLTFFSYQDSPVLSSRLAGLREAAPWLNALINRAARSTTRSWNEPVYQLRRELGLVQGGEPIYEAQHSPARVLAMFSPVLARAQTDWPRQTQICGFPYWEEPASSVDLRRELDSFVAAGPAPVVFTLGSSAVLNPGQFFTESVEAVRQLGVRAIILDGRAGSGTRVNRDILNLPYAPHSYVFPSASVIVHSGGIGTCSRAMRAGRPMLIVPFAYDQPDNASRLVRLGVARMIGRHLYTARRAGREIGKLLSDPKYRANAEHISRIVEAEDGTGAACDALENSLSGTG